MSIQAMIKDPTCDDDFDPNSLPLEQALARIRDATRTITQTETVAIRSALKRVLAEDLVSTLNVPHDTNAAMDGYALRSEDLNGDQATTLRMIDTSWAGQPYIGRIEPGECVRIFTGAVMPDNADSVIMQEYACADDDVITIKAGQRGKRFVRFAGDDLPANALALPKGKLITAADIGLIASLGVSEIRVTRKPVVAFFSTGDELRSVGQALSTGDVYDSNRYTLYGLLDEMNVDKVDLGVVRDGLEATKQALVSAAACSDIVVSTAGASAGDADFITQALDQLGEVDFWKIAMKPGRPFSFGKIEDALFFGLPGNPVSVAVTFTQLVKPALLKLMGAEQTSPMRYTVRCENNLKKQPGRMEFQRGILGADAQGQMVVKSTGGQGSHILSSMAKANCFIVLPLKQGDVSAGQLVQVEPF